METKKASKADLEKMRGVFLQVGFVVILSIVLIAFEWTSKPNIANTLGTEEALNIEEEIIPITRQQEVKPPPPPPPTVIEALNIVEDDVEIEDELEIEDTDADMDTEVDIIMIEEEEEEEEVFIIVEDMPMFQGGDLNAFRNYVQQNMEYPAIAAENGIQGRVYVQFAVNSQGKVVDAKVLRGVDPALDKEALRAVNASPKWSPGKQRGKPVKVQFNMPIVFVLQ